MELPYSAAPPSQPPNRAEAAILFCVVLSWLGAMISFQLLARHTGGPGLFCPAAGGCEAVLASKYSSFLGIPLPWLGVSFYLALLGFLLLALASATRRLRTVILGTTLWLSVAGVTYSAVLVFLQFRVLHAFCPLCTASAVVMAGLVAGLARAERIATASDAAGRRSTALAIGCCALLTSASQIASALAAHDEVLATVDGQHFTRAQMDQEIGASLEAGRRSLYDLEFAWVRKKVEETLLAKEAATRGTTVEGLLAAHATNRDEFLGQLATTHQAEVFLRAPKVRWVQVDLATARLAGPRDAPVQLVVFSDFQCRYCAELAGVLKRIRTEFRDEVLLAYRYFPLEIHDRAIPAAIAAECAAEQGRFWEYHDQLFANGADLSDATLLRLADAAGLDGERFAQCLAAGPAREIVERSRKEAADRGLDGAPTLVLNGRVIGGRVAYNRLAELLRGELAAAKAQRPVR